MGSIQPPVTVFKNIFISSVDQKHINISCQSQSSLILKSLFAPPHGSQHNICDLLAAVNSSNGISTVYPDVGQNTNTPITITLPNGEFRFVIGESAPTVWFLNQGKPVPQLLRLTTKPVSRNSNINALPYFVTEATATSRSIAEIVFDVADTNALLFLVHLPLHIKSCKMTEPIREKMSPYLQGGILFIHIIQKRRQVQGVIMRDRQGIGKGGYWEEDGGEELGWREKIVLSKEEETEFMEE